MASESAASGRVAASDILERARVESKVTVDAVLASIRGDVEIDALGYHDRELEEEDGAREEVEKLVAAEMGKFAPRDYLSLLPPLPPIMSFPEESIADTEWKRVQTTGRRVGSTKATSEERARVARVGPSRGTDAPVSEWVEAVRRAEVAIEEAKSRTVHAELSDRYGSILWNLESRDADASLRNIKKMTEKAEHVAEGISRGRKRVAEVEGAQLERNTRRLHDAIRDNAKLEFKKAALDAEIRTLKRKLEK